MQQITQQVIDSFNKHYGNTGQCSDLHRIGRVIAKLNKIEYCEDTMKEAMYQYHQDRIYEFKD